MRAMALQFCFKVKEKQELYLNTHLILTNGLDLKVKEKQELYLNIFF